jgi:hypothetical protein
LKQHAKVLFVFVDIICCTELGLRFFEAQEQMAIEGAMLLNTRRNGAVSFGSAESRFPRNSIFK